VSDTPEHLHAAPQHLAVKRVDEVRAAREPTLSWKDLRARTPNHEKAAAVSSPP